MSRNRSLKSVGVLAITLLSLQTSSALAWQDKNEDAGELFQQAMEEMQAEEFGKAAELFEKVVKLQADNGRAWQLLGYSLHSDGKLDAAIRAHKQTVEFPEFRGIALYNLGCAYSLKKDADKAFGYLNQAVDEGFDGLNYYETDADLAFLRKDERFASLIRKVKGEETAGLEVEKLVGTWTYATGVRAGVKVEKERLIGEVKITKKTFTLPAGPDSEFVMKYEVDVKKSPATIDFEIESGPVNEGKAVGIIKIEKDEITLCYDPMGEKRPTKFESTEENGCFLFTLTRKVEKKDE